MLAKRIKCSSSIYYDGECTEDVEVTIDSSILDCPICFQPLKLPLFQCINGHVACSECSPKLIGKCPICSTSHTSRCIPFESIVRSNKAKCPYTKSGCRKSMPHNQIATHKNMCTYGPCTCPIPGCNFTCEEIMLSSHISTEHAGYEQQKAFYLGHWFSVMVQKEQPYILQIRLLDYVYVLVCRRIELGYALWIAQVSSDVEGTCLGYELEVESIGGNSLKLKAVIQNVRNLDKEGSPELFMYVQPNLFTWTGHLNVKINISLLGHRIESVLC